MAGTGVTVLGVGAQSAFAFATGLVILGGALVIRFRFRRGKTPGDI